MELIKTCQKCGKQFTARRRDAKFCSDSCRVGYRTTGNRIDVDLRAARRAVARAATTLAKYPDMARSQHLAELAGLYRDIPPLGDKIQKMIEKGKTK